MRPSWIPSPRSTMLNGVLNTYIFVVLSKVRTPSFGGVTVVIAIPLNSVAEVPTVAIN